MFNNSFLMVIGLNPSTADERVDDPTIRRCVQFAKRWGYGALCMTNLFAYRATDPKIMKAQARPVGEDNDRWLALCAERASDVVAAWGMHGTHMNRDREALFWLPALKCLGTNSDGTPRHPLYISYDTELQPYPTIKYLAKL